MSISGSVFAVDQKDVGKLPEYVAFDYIKSEKIPGVLQLKAAEIALPLSEGDKKDIEILSNKFDAEKSCAGLAAPQIGISKRVVIISVPDDPELKLWRSDLVDTLQKTVWINPMYKGIEVSGYAEDYEGCFSVNGVTGPVKRYKEIMYEAYQYTLAGEVIKVAGKAKGFLARAIQHEIDHLDGILWIDKVDPKMIMPIDEYRRIRRLELEQKRNSLENKEEL